MREGVGRQQFAAVAASLPGEDSFVDQLSSTSSNEVERGEVVGDLELFDFFSPKEYFRTPIEEKRPERVKLGDGTYAFRYACFCLRSSKSLIVVGCRYAGALKEICVNQFEGGSHEIGYWIPDLEGVKDRFAVGDNLKGKLSVAAARVDYFGDPGSLIDKVVLQGSNVFESDRLDAVLGVLQHKLKGSVSWRSLTLVFAAGSTLEQRVSVDKFGNIRLSFDFGELAVKSLIATSRYLAKCSALGTICPLRRRSEEPDME